MNSYLLPLLRTLIRKEQDTEISPIESKLETYTAPENKLESFRQITDYPNNGYLPLTWPHIAAWPLQMKHLTRPEFPLKLPGIVHISNSLWQKRPIGSGEKLNLLSSLEKGPEHPRGRTFVLINKVLINGDIVWMGHSTMLHREDLNPAVPRHPPITSHDGIGARNKIWAISPHIPTKYAMISGDLNPIHLSAISAKIFGFKGIVAHGMWTLAKIIGEHEDLLREENIFVKCEFKKPLILPNHVAYRFWPLSKNRDEIEFRVLDPQNQTIYALGSMGRTTSGTIGIEGV